MMKMNDDHKQWTYNGFKPYKKLEKDKQKLSREHQNLHVKKFKLYQCTNLQGLEERRLGLEIFYIL